MNTTKKAQARDLQPRLPSLATIQQELGTAKSIDDFFGKDGVSGAHWARLFADTLETMLEAELTEHLGYERYASKGRNSGNSRNGKRPKKLRTSAGDTEVQFPRDPNSEFSSKLLEKHRTSTNELEEKILAMYGKGMSTRDIQHLLEETYGVDVSADTISAIMDKVWPLVEAWQNRPLAAIYPIIYLDGFHLKLRRQGRVENVAVYIVLGVDLEGHRDVLGHWLGDGAEGATFFNYPTEIRRLIYTTNAIEGYNRGLRKVVKTKASFPTPEAARKLLYLANQNITKAWTMPIHNWAHILNQLVIRFEGRLPI